MFDESLKQAAQQRPSSGPAPPKSLLPGALFSGLQAASMRAATYGTTYGTVRIGLCEPLQEVAGRSGGAVIAGVLATVVGNPFEAQELEEGVDNTGWFWKLQWK